jgi:hypothetical protein
VLIEVHRWKAVSRACWAPRAGEVPTPAMGEVPDERLKAPAFAYGWRRTLPSRNAPRQLMRFADF